MSGHCRQLEIIPDHAAARHAERTSDLPGAHPGTSICRVCRMVSSPLAGIRAPVLINEGLDAPGTDPNENADLPEEARPEIDRNAGRLHFEMVAGSNRNSGRLHVGIPGRNKSESAIPGAITFLP